MNSPSSCMTRSSPGSTGAAYSRKATHRACNKALLPEPTPPTTATSSPPGKTGSMVCPGKDQPYGAYVSLWQHNGVPQVGQRFEEVCQEELFCVISSRCLVLESLSISLDICRDGMLVFRWQFGDPIWNHFHWSPGCYGKGTQ